MNINESHQMQPSSNGRYNVCTACGVTDIALNLLILENACSGKPPRLLVIDDSDLVAIQWEFPEGGVKKSSFPQPLITIDYALDKRPIQVVFAGARARELKETIAKPLYKIIDEKIDSIGELVAAQERVVQAWDEWAEGKTLEDSFEKLKAAVDELR